MVKLSIRRPVAVAMTYFAVALLGAFAWRNIPIENLPDEQLPRLNVTAQWRGASPETVEAFLTSPLESTIQLVPGVENINSESYEQSGFGQTRIEVEFNRDTDMDFARLDLSERISQLEEDLPDGVSNVNVEMYTPRELQSNNQDWVLAYRMTGPYQLEALREHIDDIVRPALEQLDGVALVAVQGGRERQIRFELDEDQILALGLTAEEVSQRIRELEIVREAGTIRDAQGERTLTIRDQVTRVSELQNAIITVRDDKIVRVSDVAHVSDTYDEPVNLVRINSNPTVTFAVAKEDGVNTVDVAERVKAEVERLQAFNPFGSEIIEYSDQSEDIKKQLVELRARAGIGGLVILLVLIGFLQSFRSGVVVFATIVFSVLISLNLIYFGGLTLNLLTLMGLAMGFGLIVDNSIVVLENVYRRWQKGEDATEAAEEGAREVVLPIVASTATTLIVFVPFVYLQGELRVFYVPLAIVVGLTLIASIFVAFTFIPSLSARLLARDTRRSEKIRRTDPAGGPRKAPIYERFYRALVGFNLRNPVLAITIGVACFGGSYYLFDKYVSRGVLWGGGGGQQESYVQVFIDLPRGASIDRTDQLTRFFEERIAQMPEVEQYVSTVREQRSDIRMTFPEELNFTQVPVAIKEQMVGFSLQFTGANVRVYGDGPAFGYGGGGSSPNYSIQVLGYNYETVRDIAENLGARLERMSRIEEVDTNSSSWGFTRDKASEFIVQIDRANLARYDMDVTFLVNQLNSAVGGASVDNRIRIEGEEVAYTVKLAGSEYADVLELTQTVVRTPNGSAIRLGDVVTVTERDVLARIRRENQQYERTVAYEFRGPTKLGDLIRDQVLATTVVPDGYTVEAAERWRWSTEERAQIYMVLIVSILLVYMVTAALFESIKQPLAVLLTVPMALIGVFLMFFYADASFTREAYIGVIMMGGIVVNNAILLVDHVNKVRLRPGLKFLDAIITGTVERVRPILRTTATTVLGLLPLVLFSETADQNIWNALGYALIGGLLSSTFFVLTLTPVLYMLFERKAARRAERRAERAGGPRLPDGLTPAPAGD